MAQFDFSTYLITQNKPGGPLLLWEPDDAYPDIFDPNEVVTKGQKIGFILGAILLLGFMIWLVTLIP